MGIDVLGHCPSGNGRLETEIHQVQQTQFVSITNTCRLMLYRETLLGESYGTLRHISLEKCRVFFMSDFAVRVARVGV
jgi:hypothetical protein